MTPESEFNVWHIAYISLIIPNRVFKFGENMASCCHVTYLKIDQNTLLFLWFQAPHHFLKDLRHFMVIDILKNVFLLQIYTQKRTKNKTQRKMETWCRMAERGSSYIEKQKRKHDGHIWVSKSTLSFFVRKVKREIWWVTRYTLFSRSNLHYSSEAQLFLVEMGPSI